MHCEEVKGLEELEAEEERIGVIGWGESIRDGEESEMAVVRDVVVNTFVSAIYESVNPSDLSFKAFFVVTGHTIFGLDDFEDLVPSSVITIGKDVMIPETVVFN